MTIFGRKDTMSRADAALWKSARKLCDLGELTAQWLERRITSHPTWPPADGPAAETGEIIPELVKLNRAGFVTSGSQPGGDTCIRGIRWQKRAAVEGWADVFLGGRIVTAAAQADLIVIVHDCADLPEVRTNVSRAVWTTMLDGEGYTRFGAQPSRADIATEYSACRPEAIEALCQAFRIFVIDPEWGRRDRLWPVLADCLSDQPG
jgi:hypothetical protein